MALWFSGWDLMSAVVVGNCACLGFATVIVFWLFGGCSLRWSGLLFYLLIAL